MHAQGAVDEDKDDVQFLVNNLDEVEDYLGLLVSSETTIHVTVPMLQANIIEANFIAFQLTDPILLLDSCSTLNLLIANKTMLHDIHKVDKMMNVRCNMGETTMNLIGWLRDFPEPVWFNPKGVTNILSLFIVTKYYHVQFDSKNNNALIVTKPNGNVSRFAPTEKVSMHTPAQMRINPVDGHSSTLSRNASKSTPSMSTVTCSLPRKFKT
jgi:hypothetical protein